MCLTLKNPTTKLTIEEAIKLHKKVATKNITVYKVLGIVGNGYQTPYQNYPMDLNTHYYNVGKNKFTFDLSYYKLNVNQGLHAYTSLAKAKLKAMSGYLKCWWPDRVIVKCIIPKKSVYFINEYKHEICTDNLIITDQIIPK